DNPALAEAIAAALDRDERAEDAAAGAPPSPAGPSAPSDVRADVALIRHHIPGFAVNALRALDRLEAAAARAGAPPADTTPTESGACVEWCPMCRKASEAGGAPPAAPTWPADAIRQAYIAGALLTVEFPEHDLPQVEEYADVYMAALRPPQEEEPQP
ncbi:MAG TPA: hypothetical protein VFF65_12910, partial [Phycisphaerales bacterium]|nr:hypothetical protein [Phycisphaerales bacterium]